MAKPILILGAQGQVGRALCHLLGTDAIGLGRDKADLSKPESLPDVLDHYAPSAVINAAAYNLVDKAEQETVLAFAVNAQSPGILAAWCKSADIPFIHYSTDYVFDGSGDKPWREEDTPHPLSAYGKSKYEGEMNVEKAGGKYLIFRTSWVYDAHGKNFLNAILRLAAEKEELKVVADQFGAPTYAPHLAKATITALRHATILPRFPSGLYHACNQGETSWYEFARAIVKQAQDGGLHLWVNKVTPIPATEYKTTALRPANSRLDCTRAKSILGLSLPFWQEGLADCLKEKHAHH